MAPGTTVPVESYSPPTESTTKSRNTEPLKKSGSLESTFAFEEVTPAIGREYPSANIVDDFLNSANGDELLRDLAITSKSIGGGDRSSLWILRHGLC